MKTRNTLEIKKNSLLAWDVLGNQFGNIEEWASIISQSNAFGASNFTGALFSERTVLGKNGESVHSLTDYNTDDMSLAYKVTSGAPPFAQNIGAEWKVSPVGDESCEVSVELHVDFKPGIPQEKQNEAQQFLSMSGEQILEELKHYVETGKQHPRKVASMKT